MKDDEYMYECTACNSQGYYDNLAKHLLTDSHFNKVDADQKEEISSAVEAYEVFRDRAKKKL